MTDATPRSTSTWKSSLLAPIALLLTAALLALPYFMPDFSMLEGWDVFSGRLHPLVVHFPIVLMILPLIFWLVMGLGKKESLRNALPWIWGLAVVTSLVSVIFGYFLYQSGEYAGELVENHFWGGIAVAVAAIWCAWTYARYRRTNRKLWRNLYILLMLAGNAAVAYTGHLGGTLTHGEEFLTEVLPMNPFTDASTARMGTSNEDPASLRVFDDMLMPVFKARCQSCHNANKAKGGLIMTSFEELAYGGKSEKPILVGGMPDSSELYKRIALPMDHDDHMPPEGKKPMHADEVALLHWWISSGANTMDTLGTGPSEPTAKAAVDRYVEKLTQKRQRFADGTSARKKLEPELSALGKRLGLIIQPDPDSDSLYFSVSMQIPPVKVTDESLAELQEYAPAFSRISLVATDITDEGLYYLQGMTNLRRLFLQKTCIKGEGLVHLKGLDKLEVLGLSHTDVDDQAVLRLMDFPALKQVYLFNTRVGENVVYALDQYLDSVKVSQEEGPYF